MVISLFANYSYKLVFIFIIATVIHKNINNIEKTILYFFFFTNPLIMIYGISGGISIIEFSLFFVNRICGYYLNFLIIKNFYSIIINESMSSNEKPILNYHTINLPLSSIDEVMLLIIDCGLSL